MLLSSQRVETHGVARNANSQLWVFFWMRNRIFQSFTLQYVYVQMLATFDTWCRFDSHFTAFELTKIVDANHLISFKAFQRSNTACFILFAI
ncbi:Uncharacterised protein [Vibrio cholerae]|nr:Uncharacterised protein [Vibrio cholerae]